MFMSIYNRMNSRLFLLAVFLLTSCASTNKITQDYNADTDFHHYKSFSWNNLSSDLIEVDKANIENAINQLLTQKNFALSDNKADLLINLHIIKQRSNSGGSSGLGISIGLPIGNHGAIGLGTSKLLSQNDKQEGLIIMDITDRNTNRVIWRGSAEAIPLSYFFLKNQGQLNSVLEKLVNQFPPK